MKVREVAELISDNELVIETMDAECRCIDYIGDDVDGFMECDIAGIFAHNDVIYLRVEV